VCEEICSSPIFIQHVGEVEHIIAQCELISSVANFQSELLFKLHINYMLEWQTGTISFGHLTAVIAQIFVSFNIGIQKILLLLSAIGNSIDCVCQEDCTLKICCSWNINQVITCIRCKYVIVHRAVPVYIT